jgi:alpha-ribazole phosphatase
MVTRFEIDMDACGNLKGSFETLYGGKQQPSLIDYIMSL